MTSSTKTSDYVNIKSDEVSFNEVKKRLLDSNEEDLKWSIKDDLYQIKGMSEYDMIAPYILGIDNPRNKAAATLLLTDMDYLYKTLKPETSYTLNLLFGGLCDSLEKHDMLKNLNTFPFYLNTHTRWFYTIIVSILEYAITDNNSTIINTLYKLSPFNIKRAVKFDLNTAIRSAVENGNFNVLATLKTYGLKTDRVRQIIKSSFTDRMLTYYETPKKGKENVFMSYTFRRLQAVFGNNVFMESARSKFIESLHTKLWPSEKPSAQVKSENKLKISK